MIAGNLTTEEIKSHKNAVAIIPFGAFEQHGPYLPLLTDTYIAESIASMVEASNPTGVMLYPAVWFGDSIEHDGFDGTLSVNAFDMMHVLQNLFEWLAKSGFSKAILYNAHGGNVNLAATICEEFSRQSSLKVVSMFAYTPAVRARAKDLFGVSDTHGGSTETSLLYYLRPEVQKTKEKTIQNLHPYPGGGLLSLYSVRELSENGVLEKNVKITIDTVKGKALSEVLVEALTHQVEHFPGKGKTTVQV